ncbi:hypothetical protein L9F63_005897 [Diploptera punctata]|uniref:Cytochrome P450 n=1 Tax=Diploptera punctata TaxID=6984 RepID=A0AAD7ZBM0_DIPPU|nr:hypothetical protein L9F63_005897 [Diploptera punctata]
MLEIFQSSFLLQASLSLCVILIAIYAYFKRSFSYWNRRGVPSLNPSVPFGNFTKLRSNIEDYSKFYKKLHGKKIGGLYKFNKPILLLRDPEIIKNVLVKDFDLFYSRGIFVNEEKEPLVGNLFLLNGPKWKNLRAKLTPTFTSGKIKMMFPTLVQIGKELQKCLKISADNEDAMEVKDILSRYNTDIIASCAFGIQCNSLENPNTEFRVWGKKFFSPDFQFIIKSILIIIIPFLRKYLRISLVSKNVSKYFRNMVKNTVEYRENNNVQRNDFMQLLIQLKNKTLGATEEDPLLKIPDSSITALKSNSPFDCLQNSEVTMDVIAAQAFVFFIGGFETSSTTITFCLYELALNPDIQETVQIEIDSVLKKYYGDITYEANVVQLTLVFLQLSKTLRKYPPAPVITRQCTQTTKLTGTDIVVEKGTAVHVPVLQIHHDPKYYLKPEKFDPERFSEEEKNKRRHFTFLPFGEGPRLCIGMRFGLMQTKVGVISILSNYTVQVSAKTSIPLKIDPNSLILSPEGGMWLKITNRINK